MTEHEIVFWLRQQLAVGEAMLKVPQPSTPAPAWHGHITEAMASLRRAQYDLRHRLGLIVPLPQEPDHNAPYICMGCRLVYPVTPDPNAYDCSFCGAKVCPVRLWRRQQLACDKGDCDGAMTFYRCDGRMKCTCGLIYYDHPYCKNSAHAAQFNSSMFPEYALHVLCNGDHIKT